MTDFIQTHADDQTVRWFHLFELDLPGPTTIYWTDDQLPIFYGGHVYTPAVVTPDSISTEQGQTATGNVTVGNADNVFGAYLFSSDITGSILKVWQAWLDATTPGQVPQLTRQVFLGRIDSVTLTRTATDSEVKLALGPYSDPTLKLIPTILTSSLLKH